MKKRKPGANSVLWLSRPISFGLVLAIILLTTPSCQKKRLSDEMCDCADSETQIKISDTLWLQIPNVFTPNGDPYNQFWELDSIHHLPNVIVRVIDERLLDKKIIFESVGYDEPWDGTRNNGKKPKDGKYKYEIEFAGRKITGYVCVFGTSDFDPTEQDCFNRLYYADSGDPVLW